MNFKHWLESWQGEDRGKRYVTLEAKWVFYQKQWYAAAPVLEYIELMWNDLEWEGDSAELHFIDKTCQGFMGYSVRVSHTLENFITPSILKEMVKTKKLNKNWPKASHACSRYLQAIDALLAHHKRGDILQANTFFKMDGLVHGIGPGLNSMSRAIDSIHPLFLPPSRKVLQKAVEDGKMPWHGQRDDLWFVLSACDHKFGDDEDDDDDGEDWRRGNNGPDDRPTPPPRPTNGKELDKQKSTMALAT